jgi:hypothetical protein
MNASDRWEPMGGKQDAAGVCTNLCLQLIKGLEGKPGVISAIDSVLQPDTQLNPHKKKPTYFGQNLFCNLSNALCKI